MNRLFLPAFSIVLLLIVAAAITYFLGWRLDTQVYCVDGSGIGPGCRTNWGMALALMWGIVAVCAGLIWNRIRNM